MEKQKLAALPKTEQKRRLKSFLWSALFVLGIGLIYYLIVSFTDFSIPCLIKKLTGKFCPGCGISRMCIAILHCDMKTAYLCNRLLFLLLPVLLVYGVWREYRYIRYDDTTMRPFEMTGIIIVFVLTVVFSILRNTEAFSYLQPLG